MSSGRRSGGPRLCKENGCEGAHYARGFCARHYRTWLRDGGLGVCALPHCDGGTWANGLCLPHYKRAKKYRLTVEDLVLIDARAQCDICTNEPAVVDHDHRTGEVRGVLCGPCNLLLGHAADDVSRLVGAIRYLYNPPGA